MGATLFQVEAWIEFAIGILILLGRIIYRGHTRGRNWNGDDFFAVLAVCFLTGETVMLELIGRWGTIVSITDEKALSLTEQEKEDMIKGSKADVAGWCLYISLIWCLKACMLFFYCRLTLDTGLKRLVYFAGIACVSSYIAIIGVVLLRCLPFEKNWQVYPYPGDECAMPNQILLALVVTNVSTDLLILYIPIPLLWVLQAPIGRKIAYALWLTTGAFVIVATLLRCVLSVRFASEVDVSTIWAIRETFVGIIAVNIPILGPFLVKKCKAFASTISSKRTSRSDPTLNRPSLVTFGQGGGVPLERIKKMVKGYDTTGTTITAWEATANGSQERVNVPQDAASIPPTTANSDISATHFSPQHV